MMQLIDIHSHFDMLEDTPEVVIEKAAAANVHRIVTIGTEPKDHQYVLDIARKFYPKVYCTLGVHPHQGIAWDENVGKFISSHLHEKEVIAVGEIGLDYYYNQSPKDRQIEAFRKQMEIAAQHQMPVQIHTRDADQDTVDIIKEFSGKVHGVIHCFTGTPWLAEQCLGYGYNISFSGIVTFKNAEALRDVCRSVPLDRMHVETDAPFLAPVPMRGRKNTPAFVAHTAEFVAKLRNLSTAELARITTENTLRMFPKMKAYSPS